MQNNPDVKIANTTTQHGDYTRIATLTLHHKSSSDVSFICLLNSFNNVYIKIERFAQLYSR